MAIGIHTVEISELTESGIRVQRVVEGSGTAPGNAAGDPTVAAYLEAEAGDDFLPTYIGGGWVVTISASDTNAA